MKKITSILAFVLALSMLSCTKDGPMTINEITDHYTAPAGATVMNLSKAESAWALDRRYFKLDFGSDLVTTLVAYDALLTPGQYVLGADAIGNAIDTKVKGADAQSGYVLVTRKNDQYQVTGTFGDQVLYWTGTLPFTPDPAPTRLTEVMSAQSNLANGVQSLTMSLATPGIAQEYDENWQQVWTGEGGYLALDIYSDDGYLHDGVYTACTTGGAIEPGQFGIGYDTDVEFWGQVFHVENWGTCWWEVAGGKATATKITDGLVTVTSREEKVEDKDVTIWTIFWGLEYPQELLFEGAIPALTKPKPIGPVDFDYTYTIGEPQACILNDNTTVVEGVKKYPFTIVDKNGKEVAYLEFVLADGAADVEPGDYVSTEYAHEVGQLANGYYLDYSEWGWGIIKGGSYYVDGTGENVYIAPEVVVSVTSVGAGVFKFASDGFDFTAAGPNYVPGGGGDSGPVYDMTDTVASDCTDAQNTPYTDVESHTFVLKDGEQFVAQIKLVRSVGATDFAGTYTVTEYAHEDFTAGNGFDLGVYFGMDPFAYVIGSYYKDGDNVVIIEPGETITVTSAGAGTWKFVGSTGFSFTGKLQ